jgi:hypothetical protein
LNDLAGLLGTILGVAQADERRGRREARGGDAQRGAAAAARGERDGLADTLPALDGEGVAVSDRHAVVVGVSEPESVVPPLVDARLDDDALVADCRGPRGATAAVLTRDAFEALYGTRLDRLERCGGRSWPIWPGAGVCDAQDMRANDGGA